ncbi:MAG: glutamine--fructose-6-phosphate transaminase (isomerizing) [Deltaproteobacteria bacterium]|nr:glutamine--fructose-6-phosphate transaminase (isomerizing) [Deltaproteobacteria bacterium]
MCGIVGYIGREHRAMDVLMDGLRRLEYRGYDSAGVAVHDGARIEVRRAMGKLVNLDGVLRDSPLEGGAGIGHTRWATHGRPSEANAHPHRAGSVVVVHNGIIENHTTLRAGLRERGCEIVSETDTELIAHLVNEEMEAGKGLMEAVLAATAKCVGSYALGVISDREPDQMVAAKNGGSPIILGLADDQAFMASDIPAILPYTRRMIFLEDGDFALLSRGGCEIVAADASPIEREVRTIQWDPVSAEKGGYDRFMQKEIFEQPRAISDTIGARILDEEAEVDLDGISFTADEVRGYSRIYLLACGTSWHACLIGKYMIEQLAGIPVEVDLASEFRYRKPIIDDSCLVITVSQSGETADTLAALREAKSLGARILAICNVRDSTIPRESDDVLYTHAGPEIGVASTKAFTTQVVAFYLTALKLGSVSGRLSPDEMRKHIGDLRRLPRLVDEALATDEHVRGIAQKYFHASDFLFLGRGIMFPAALEGALKLKEISYIHAEGYAAGEMKHGPIALIDEDMPVVVIANRSPVYDKVVSNLEEVRAREGIVIAVASEGDEAIEECADDVIRVPDLGDFLTSILVSVPLQLLAYHVAVLKGTDVDQPRNLAKSVTVE